jgi:hypothetical protein
MTNDKVLYSLWFWFGYGGAMYQQVSNTGAEYKHWNLWGDLAADQQPDRRVLACAAHRCVW